MSTAIQATYVLAVLMVLLLVDIIYVFTVRKDRAFYHKELVNEIKLFFAYRKIEKCCHLYTTRKCHPLSNLPVLHKKMEKFLTQDLKCLSSLKLAIIFRGGFYVKLILFVTTTIFQIALIGYWPLSELKLEIIVVLLCIPILKLQTLCRKKSISTIAKSLYIIDGREIDFEKLFKFTKSSEYSKTRPPLLAKLYYYSRQTQSIGDVIYIPGEIEACIEQIKDDELQEFVSSELFKKIKIEGVNKYENNIKEFRVKWHAAHKQELEKEELKLAIEYSTRFSAENTHAGEYKKCAISDYPKYMKCTDSPQTIE